MMQNEDVGSYVENEILQLSENILANKGWNWKELPNFYG